MISATHRKIAAGFIFGFSIIFMYDEVIKLFLLLVQFLFELIEYSLEFLIKHIFHTTHHQSEVILFNLLLVVGLYGLYRLRRALPSIKRNLIAIYMRHKKRVSFYWRMLPTNQKIKQVVVYATGFICILFLFFI